MQLCQFTCREPGKKTANTVTLAGMRTLYAINNGKPQCCSHDIDQSLLNSVEDIIGPNTQSEDTTEQLDLIYGLEEVPAWHTCFFLGLQHVLLMIGSVIGLPFILIPKLCMDFHEEAVGLFISNVMFVSGVVTFLQTTFGIR
ncbi:Solute carrier family 23 member 2 [Nymphon striatum]|nr:Solute carrier family 23 member 2 [Nymphon striatum]